MRSRWGVPEGRTSPQEHPFDSQWHTSEREEGQRLLGRSACERTVMAHKGQPSSLVVLGQPTTGIL